MFIAIKWIKGKPYKYRLRCVYDKEAKKPRNEFVEYLGPATDADIQEHYKGEKTV